MIKMPPQLMTSQALFQTFGPSSSEPHVFPRTPLSVLSTSPCCIVCLCQGFVWKSKPANAREQRYFVRPDDMFVVICWEGYFIHLFCCETMLATSNDIHRPQLWFFTFEWLSLRERQRFVWGSPRCGHTRSLLLNEGKSLVSPCAHCLPIQLHKVSSQVFDVTWMHFSKIA